MTSVPPSTRQFTLAAKPRELTPLDPGTVRLSVLIPVYNERNTIETILDRVHATPMRKEIICVDDCSTDGTQQILEALLAQGYIDQLHRQQKNSVKGAAIPKALSMSTGEIVIVQDADLEYDPQDWPVLLDPIDRQGGCVLRSRFLGGPHRVLYYRHSVGNTLLTLFSNMLTNLNLTDMETCYKAVRGDSRARWP
jgi:glycosyltransferase involved in cell wall biosynthesis